MKKATLNSTIWMAVGLILLAGGRANATSPDSSIVIDGRADYLSQSYNDDASSPGGARPTNSVFRFPSFRVDFKGKIGEETAYRLRLNIPNAAVATTYPAPADNMSSFVDFAYITRALTSNLKLTVGKQWLGTAGWVGTYDPADVYLYPKGFLDGVTNNLTYGTGVGLQYEGMGQKVSLVASNPGAASTDNGTATGNANNSRQALGGRYFGKFLDATLQPTLSYLVEGIQNQTASSKNLVYTFSSVGIRYTVPAFDIDADYIMNSFADKTTTGSSDGTTSLYILARYKMPEIGLKQFLGYENSTQKTETSATVEKNVTTTSYQVGIEYYPKKDEDFRFHLVYSGQSANTDLGTGAASTKQNQQQIIAGIRFKADLLK